MQVLHKNRKVGGKVKIDMTKIYAKNASWEFLLSCKKIQTGKFVCQQKDCSQKIAVRCETSRFFSAESNKATLEKSRDTCATGG